MANEYTPGQLAMARKVCASRVTTAEARNSILGGAWDSTTEMQIALAAIADTPNAGWMIARQALGREG
jgi:hypothetical protein